MRDRYRPSMPYNSETTVRDESGFGRMCMTDRSWLVGICTLVLPDDLKLQVRRRNLERLPASRTALCIYEQPKLVLAPIVDHPYPDLE